MIEADIYSDGSRFDENGPVGWACQVIVGDTTNHRYELSGQLPSNSVLLAELQGAYAGIELAIQHHAKNIRVYTDCTSLINLALGKNPLPTNPDLATRLTQIHTWQQTTPINWIWTKAHLKGGSDGNSRADYLAKQALKPHPR